MKNFLSIRNILVVLSLSVLLAISAIATEMLPADRAGTINKPTGQLALNRNGDIWVMDVDGQNQQMICASGNADGKLTWSPDNKIIAFTRSGKVNYQSPDNLGGQHKLYDIFLCYMDSAYANNRQFWYRISDGLGSRDPEWSRDGSHILYYKDMNANKIDAFAPNYQICTMEPDGSSVDLIRKDWQNFYESFLTAPTSNDRGDIATVFFNKQRPIGLVVIPANQYMADIDSLFRVAEKNHGIIAPSWSPDGQWIAYMSNNLQEGGLYIATPDLKEKYLVTAPPVGTYMYTVAPSWSPDSKWLTFSTTDGSIWIIDIMGGGARRLTGPGPDKSPAWSK